MSGLGLGLCGLVCAVWGGLGLWWVLVGPASGAFSWVAGDGVWWVLAPLWWVLVGRKGPEWVVVGPRSWGMRGYLGSTFKRELRVWAQSLRPEKQRGLLGDPED